MFTGQVNVLQSERQKLTKNYLKLQLKKQDQKNIEKGVLIGFKQF